MEIEVKGHSGCNIDIVRDGKSLFIHKSTDDPAYVSRLYRQAIKQQEASKHAYQYIRVPEIYSIEHSDSHMLMRMEYVYSKNFVDYFENAGFEQISYFVKAINIFINSEIEHSKTEKVDASVILNKWEDVRRRVKANPLLQGDAQIEEIMRGSASVFESMPAYIEMPVGECHGDLTFSNILFNGNNYYLIDFLDSFIESPLLDMVKIRQDTAYMWSVLMYTGHYDNTRLHVVCRKLDEQLDASFMKYDWYAKYYKQLQLMNFLRILQYAHEPRVIDYLKNVLLKMLEK